MLKTIPPTTNCGCGYFKSKCAEIHYQSSSFSILCIFCGLKTLDLHDFIDHFHKIHFEDFLSSMQCTNETIVSHINEPAPKTKKTVNSNDPLEIADREIVDDLEEQMKKLKDCDELDNLKKEATEESDEDYFGDKLLTGNDSGLVQTDENDSNCNRIVENTKPQEVPELKRIDGTSEVDLCSTADKKRQSIVKSFSARKERNQPLICNHCGREFKRSYQLAYHMNIHTGAKPFQCEVCGKQFKARTTLTRHLTTHEQRSAYSCEFCNKCFTHKAAMLSHQLRHTQIRSFKCDECEKLFYTCNQVETHKRKMHAGDDASLPFVCDMCGKRYRTASMLSTHRHKKHFAHAPFACDKCEKKFVDEKQLQIHKAIHTETYTFNH